MARTIESTSTGGEGEGETDSSAGAGDVLIEAVGERVEKEERVELRDGAGDGVPDCEVLGALECELELVPVSDDEAAPVGE